METKYKVNSGDRLSDIAKKYGVKVSDISGYKSGDPNLIYQGEVLNIPTTAPKIAGIPLQPSGQEKLSIASFEQGTPVTKSVAPTVAPTLGVQPSPMANAATTTPIIAPTPIITTTKNPKIGISQIDAGKEVIKELTDLGVSTDINTIRSNWSKFGLDTKLGTWTGNAIQWNAYNKYSKDELNKIGEEAKKIQEQTTKVQEQVATEGITETPTEVSKTEGGGTGTTGEGSKVLDPNTLGTVQLSNLDIGDIITEIESGTAASPETVIAGEEKALLTDAEKSKVAGALETFQQQMAKAGQAFSSIRSSGEAGIAAQSLSNLSGINLDLATKIVNAARQEQTRRVNALDLQQKAQSAALESMGYVIDPITGTLQKTLAREKSETVKPVRFSSGRNVYEYDPATGGITTLIEGVDTPPTSYQEWMLAGEQSGTGKSYAEYLSDKGETQSEKTTALKIAAFAKARPQLEMDRGADGYVNPVNYMRLRSDFAEVIGDVTEFDELFAPMLSIQNRLRLGVGKTTI